MPERSEYLHEMLLRGARQHPDRVATLSASGSLSYGELLRRSLNVASYIRSSSPNRSPRIAVFLPNSEEFAVVAFAASIAGGVFVPINPQLRTAQVLHILENSQASVLVTTADLFSRVPHDSLSAIGTCNVMVVGETDDGSTKTGAAGLSIESLARITLLDGDDQSLLDATRGGDPVSSPVCVLYTSGSTGLPKGVVISHDNIVRGAQIVTSYIENTPDDRLLCALPFSFDYGLNQLVSAFSCGATAVLPRSVLPQSLCDTICEFNVTGLAGVPTLWIQLGRLSRQLAACKSLRYITNSGGAMPMETLNVLRDALPKVRIFLMYGLTEAFRSTFLPPVQLAARPASMGKAIPGERLFVLRDDGTVCADDEPGELVHAGRLVTLGYLNDTVATKKRFRELPQAIRDADDPDRLAVWSGDIVTRDKDGYLYFVERRDNLIKTSGYRVSPTEVEQVVMQVPEILMAVAIGVQDAVAGQRIHVAYTASATGTEHLHREIMRICADRLPSYMRPSQLWQLADMPLSANGKPDRNTVRKRITETLG